MPRRSLRPNARLLPTVRRDLYLPFAGTPAKLAATPANLTGEPLTLTATAQLIAKPRRFLASPDPAVMVHSLLIRRQGLGSVVPLFGSSGGAISMRELAAHLDRVELQWPALAVGDAVELEVSSCAGLDLPGFAPGLLCWTLNEDQPRLRLPSFTTQRNVETEPTEFQRNQLVRFAATAESDGVLRGVRVLADPRQRGGLFVKHLRAGPAEVIVKPSSQNLDPLLPLSLVEGVRYAHRVEAGTVLELELRAMVDGCAAVQFELEVDDDDGDGKIPFYGDDGDGDGGDGEIPFYG